MPEWVYAVLGFVVLTVLLTLYSIRQRNSSWQGTVLDIRERTITDSNDQQRDEVHITYRLDNGGKKTMKLERYAYSQVYGDLQIGDRLVKEKGEFAAKRVPKA